MRPYLNTLLLLLILPAANLLAQTADKAKLEGERKAIQNELKQIQGVYNQVKGQKRETIGQLNLLQKKMFLQGKYIGSISKEVKLLGNEIYTSTLEINKLQRQLDTLRAEYARSVVYAYKNKSNYDYLNFIFSASTFNDALKRIAYLRSYRTYRQQQFANIVETQTAISNRKSELLGKKEQKNGALKNQEQQLNVLEDQKKEKDAVVAKLKSKENELSKQITMRKRKDAALKNSISAIIKREIEERRRAEEAERTRLAAAERERARAAGTAPVTTPLGSSTTKTSKTTGKKVVSAIPLNDKEIAMSSNFSSNKGKLPWPVDGGYVSVPFGTYTVPGTSLKGYNAGLTLSTPSPGANVKAVFDGEVLSTFNMDDGTRAVMISHGKYFTVYSNLASTTVSKGSNVKTGQSIGRVAADDEGGSGGKLDFTLMIERTEVNPTPWLRR